MTSVEGDIARRINDWLGKIFELLADVASYGSASNKNIKNIERLFGELAEIKVIVSKVEQTDSRKVFATCVSEVESLILNFVRLRNDTPRSIECRRRILRVLHEWHSYNVLHRISDESCRPEKPKRISMRTGSSFSKNELQYLRQVLSIGRIDDEYEHVYVCGTFDERKTFETQQMRAGLLALAIANKFNKGSPHVGVVGGGVSGLTATAALLQLGFKVTLMESDDQYCHIQKPAAHRYIHPNLYTWPSAKFSKKQKFSMCSIEWEAGFANEVVQSINESFGFIKSISCGVLEEIGDKIQRVRLVTDEVGDKKYFLHSEIKRYGPFNACILAIGFGLEPRENFGISTPSYWEAPAVYRSRASAKTEPLRVLVSGSGDGALIDCCFYSIGKFDHSSIMSVLKHKHFRDFCKELLGCEAQVRNLWASSDGTATDALPIYTEIANRYDFSDIERLADVKFLVELNSRTEGLFSPFSSIVNRALVTLLIKHEIVRVRFGQLQQEMLSRSPDDFDQTKWFVTWPSGERIGYDYVLFRHGVEKDYFRKSFPQFQERNVTLTRRLADLDIVQSCPSKIENILKEIDVFLGWKIN